MDVPEDGQASDKGNENKKGLPKTAVGEKTKGRTLIANGGDVKKVWNYLDRFVQAKALFNVNLGQLVQSDNNAGKRDQESVFGKHGGSSHRQLQNCVFGFYSALHVASKYSQIIVGAPLIKSPVPCLKAKR